MELAKSLASRLDAHVVAVDYRGFGDSTGWPSEEGACACECLRMVVVVSGCLAVE